MQAESRTLPFSLPTLARMAAITLEHVSNRYPNGVFALDDLSLTVADGELLVLVGPSGCGKSTTLRLVAGLESATSGTVAIGGRRVNDLPPRSRDIALVFRPEPSLPRFGLAPLALLLSGPQAGSTVQFLRRWCSPLPSFRSEQLPWILLTRRQ